MRYSGEYFAGAQRTIPHGDGINGAVETAIASFVVTYHECLVVRSQLTGAYNIRYPCTVDVQGDCCAVVSSRQVIPRSGRQHPAANAPIGSRDCHAPLNMAS